MADPHVPMLEMLWEAHDARGALEERFGFRDAESAGHWVAATVHEHWGIRIDSCERIVISDRNALAWVTNPSGRLLAKWSVAPERFPRLSQRAAGIRPGPVPRRPSCPEPAPQPVATSVIVLQCGKGNNQGSRPPNARVQRWVAQTLGADAVIGLRALRVDGGGPWRVQAEAGGRMLEAVLRGITSRIGRDFLATNASALLHAKRHGIAAPHLTGADLEGVIAGTPVTLETIAGDTHWPAPATPRRLRAAGAAIAEVHAISMTPQPHLPHRPRPIAVDDFARERRLGRIPTTSLLSTADERLQKLGRPRHRAVFLHGDVWPGNIAWTADGNAVLIDWKTAGVGHPGVDLGELRKQVAMHFGSDAPAHVLHGWQHQTGDPADHVAYWDAVAALNTPTYLTDWPAYDENGTLLGSTAATNRRDRFLEAALAQL